MLGIEPRALSTLGKHSARAIHPILYSNIWGYLLGPFILSIFKVFIASVTEGVIPEEVNKLVKVLLAVINILTITVETFTKFVKCERLCSLSVPKNNRYLNK